MKFKHYGIFDEEGIEGCRLRCRCNGKPIEMHWTSYHFERHFDTNGHKNWKESVERQGIQQASLAEATAYSAEKEKICCEKKGTRAQAATNIDIPFRKGAVKAYTRAGIPINKMAKMRNWIQAECKQSLSCPSALYKYVEDLLLEEKIL